MKYDEGAVRVEIDGEHLEVLLHLARIGDKAGSMRSWRTKFRRRYVCAGDEREPDCISCQAFDVAEAALVGDPSTWDQ